MVSPIIRKTLGIEAVLRGALDNVEGVKYAFVFGSYAKGEFHTGSDIDFALIGSINEDQLIREVKKAQKETNREINYHIYRQTEFVRKLKTSSFIKNIVKNHIIVAGDANEFKKYLKNLERRKPFLFNRAS